MKRKKTGYLIYIIIVIGICLLPLAALGVRPTTQTTENKPMAEWPSLQKETGWNREFLSEAGAWFDDHFAFRQELVALDAKIRSGLFGVSATDSVICGTDGWLYYEATLDDYQHRNGVSERMLFNMAHNVFLQQEYSELLGKTFLFTIAPNKNSLYDKNMPANYRKQVAELSDAQRLIPWLEKEGIHYVDLFSLFEEQDEVLYYARDSHWNQKGAVLVYNELLDACGKAHETYETVPTYETQDYLGDLNRMLYPVGAEPETELHYDKPFTYSWQEGDDVEDTFIRTSSAAGTQKLLMYRDSFGNTLLPYMAEAFAQASFSKVVPYPMTDLVTQEPDIVIVEKVERHLPTLGEVPPLMSGPQRTLEEAPVSTESNTTFHLNREGSYYKLSGIADETQLETDSRIYVEVTDQEKTAVYEAFCVRETEAGVTSDFGYLLYLSEVKVAGDSLRIRVIGETQNGCVVLYDAAEQNL